MYFYLMSGTMSLRLVVEASGLRIGRSIFTATLKANLKNSKPLTVSTGMYVARKQYHWIYFFLNLIGRPGYSARKLNCQLHWNSIQPLLPVPMLLQSVGTKLD